MAFWAHLYVTCCVREYLKSDTCLWVYICVFEILCVCMGKHLCVCILPLLLVSHLVSIRAGRIKCRKKIAKLTVFRTHSFSQTYSLLTMNKVLCFFLLCMQGYLLTHALDCADGGMDCDSGQIERKKVRAFYTFWDFTHLHLNCYEVLLKIFHIILYSIIHC